MEKIYNCSNMHCAACKANIERAVNTIDGVISCEANVVTGSVKVVSKDEISDKEIIKVTKNIGYNLKVVKDDEDLEFNDEKSSNKKLLIKIIIGLVLLIPLMYIGMGGMYHNAVPNFIKDPVFVGEYIQLGITLAIIGLFFFYYKNGFLSLIKFSFNMDTLVFIGSLFSLIFSVYLTITHTINPSEVHYEHVHLYYDSAAMILVIVSIGKYIEGLSKAKAKNTIKELLKLRPKYAHQVKGEEIVEVETKYLNVGDVILVNPGEAIPCDGLVISGTSSVNESLISGESLPIYKEEDSKVIGGSTNIDGTLKILVNKEKKDSVLSKIISLVMEASNMNTKLTRKVDTVAKYFVPVSLGISLITFLCWLLIPQPLDFQRAFTFGVNVVVVCCPCALGLATPISLLVGSSIFARNGILVNKSEAIENMKDVNVLVLDKTNTITKGELEVEKAEIFTKTLQILDEIYTLEKFSTHPLSKGIVEYLKENKVSPDFIRNGIEPGKGVYGKFKDHKIYVGNIEYLKDINEDLYKEFLNKINNEIKEGLLPIIAFNENEVFAIFCLKDKVKENAKEFVSEAKKYFERVILLTGDNNEIAHKVASEVGITEVISEVKPDEKDKVIQSLQNEGYKVMMVGDGINDSIALNRADVGVGIASGTDVAMAVSDFILMNSNLNDILNLITISKKIRNSITLNLFWAFIYNIVFMPIAAGALSFVGFTLNPMICSALMAISSVTVCINSLTLFIRAKTKK